MGCSKLVTNRFVTKPYPFFNSLLVKPKHVRPRYCFLTFWVEMFVLNENMSIYICIYMARETSNISNLVSLFLMILRESITRGWSNSATWIKRERLPPIYYIHKHTHGYFSGGSKKTKPNPWVSNDEKYTANYGGWTINQQTLL